jgi:hypothetical protein
MTGLADAIARDILADRGRAPVSPTCFACGRSFGRGDGRFCSTRCRAGFDAGLPPFDPARTVLNVPLSAWRVVAGPPGVEIGSRFYGQNAPAMPMRGDGFAIECTGCRKTFISRGLRCCSTDCERKHRERIEIAATVAEVGGELPVKRKCLACGGDIPNWRNGRRVSAATRFCSDRCGQRARKQSGSPNPAMTPESAKKCLRHKGFAQ